MDTSLLCEINRLFDEFVHDPWRQLPRAAVGQGTSEHSVLIEIPLKEGQVERIGLTAEGQRLTVTLSTVRDQRFGIAARTTAE